MLTPTSLFGILSDETRLRCFLLLLQQEEICVCEFCHVIDCIQPKISRHLAIMRTAGLILDERRGQWVYYRLNPNLTLWLLNIVKASFKELKAIEPYCSDTKKINDICEKKFCS